MGAPNTAVTELMLTSVGANMVLAIRSQNSAKTAPPRKQAGIMRSGLAVLSIVFATWGTAMPRNEIGPAKAVTQADSTLERRINSARNRRILTPMFFA